MDSTIVKIASIPDAQYYLFLLKLILTTAALVTSIAGFAGAIYKLFQFFWPMVLRTISEGLHKDFMPRTEMQELLTQLKVVTALMGEHVRRLDSGSKRMDHIQTSLANHQHDAEGRVVCHLTGD